MEQISEERFAQKSPRRDSGIDILKITACCSVILLHFVEATYTLNNSFLSYLVLNAFRWFVFGCIGYFIIATGYLNCYKEINLKHFRKLIPIIIRFLVYCILTTLIVHQYDRSVSFLSYIYGGIKWYFWEFHGYYWYMAFFFSFYLFIPFINIIINNINKTQHLLLIAISIVAISLPGLLGGLGDFWPPLKASGVALPAYIPAECFPIIYYLIGSYFRKWGRVSCYNRWVLSV